MSHSVTSLSPNGEIEEWKRFDVVSDFSDHYYRVSDQNPKFIADRFNNGSNAVHKKIMQEWKILDQHLPESIFVRVYDQRIDLLRAVIIGAAGTPYHDGLFFFDLAFPLDYPARPPQVYYRSRGLRLNPNLYASGLVCLSLLNTWSGEKNERWNPSGSTILQVLVSIQGLVLNEKPYFNEPIHDTWVVRALKEKNSRAYNENAFALSCHTMLFSLRSPPMNFEGFVAEHFRERANVILRACKAYTNGCMKVGYYKDDGSSSSSCSAVKVSAKFKDLMERLYPQLVSAFTKNGASLEDFIEQLEEVSETVSLKKPPQVIEKTTIGFRKKIINKVREILGLNTGEKNNAKS